MRRTVFFFVLFSPLVFGQTTPDFNAAFERAAVEFNVPADILKGIAFAETRWEHLTWAEGDTASCMGMPRPYGIMGLWDNAHFGHSLREAAKLIGKTPQELKLDLFQNIRGAAALLHQLHSEQPLPEGTTASDLESWRNAVALFTGIPHQDLAQNHAFRVFTFINDGYHQFHIEWPGRKVKLSEMQTAVNKIYQAESSHSGLSKRQNQPDYPYAIWRAGYPGYYYDPSGGYGKYFVVIHDMEATYEAVVSYFQTLTDGRQVSVHFCVNGKPDAASSPYSNAPAGEITQMVEEKNYAWHAICLNRYSIGIEHEGYVNNAAWFTPAMYKASSALTAYLCNKYNIPKDRNHVIGHNEWQNQAWNAWCAANGFPNTFATCNSHTDPGALWDWTGYMNLVRGDTLPPKVAWTIPAPTTTGIHTYKEIVMRFSSFMDTASVRKAFSITPIVPGSMSWSADFQSLVFHPDSLLNFNTSYTVKIDSSAKGRAYGYSLDGNGDGVAGDPYVFSFTTEAPVTTPPVVEKTYPANNALGVPTFPEFRLNWNRPLTRTPQASWFSLRNAASNPIPLTTVKFDTLGEKSFVILMPDSLLPNALYTLSVNSGVQDIYGNTTTQPLTVQFRTLANTVIPALTYDGFESNSRSWSQPSLNANSSKIDSLRTTFTFSPERKHGGISAGRLAYLFSQSSGGIIALEAAGRPVLDAYQRWGVWVYGDDSRHLLKAGFLPGPQIITLDTINWRGWKFYSLELSTVSGPTKQFTGFYVHQNSAGEPSGILYFDDLQLNATVTDAQTTDGGIPTTTQLLPNYPNPFNPTTNFQFSIANFGLVKLSVFDILGREVAVLVNEEKPAGTYRATWDASMMPSGIYFCRLESGGNIITQKMVLLR